VGAFPPGRVDRAATFLFAQLVAFACLFVVTGAVFRPIDAVIRHPAIWVVGWLALSGLTGVLWLGALLPGAALRELVRASPRSTQASPPMAMKKASPTRLYRLVSVPPGFPLTGSISDPKEKPAIMSVSEPAAWTA